MRSLGVVRLESGLTARIALERLRHGEGNPVALVHRREIGADAWYRFEAIRLISLLSAAAPEASLGSVVTLDALNRVPVTDLSEVDDATLISGVLTIGSEVIGFQEEPERPPPTPPRRSVVAVEEGGEPGAVGVDPTGPAAPGAPPPTSPAGRTPIGWRRPPKPPDEWRPPEETASLTAHGGIEAPAVVELGKPFTVEISVEPDAVPGTLGGGLFVPDLPVDADRVVLDVHLVGGFEVNDESGGYGTIEVDRVAARGGPIAFELTASAPPPWYDPQVGVWVDRVMALFSHRGTPCGQLWKEVAVNVAGDHTTAVAAGRTEVGSDATPIAPAASHTQDLTIVLTRVGGVATGRYTLTLHSPHFAFPFLPEQVDLGDDALGFAARLIRDVGQHLHDQVTQEVLHGIGRIISDLLPDKLWEAVRTVGDAVGGDAVPADRRRAPVVLLLTDEPYVPWELAVMPQPLDPSCPPFLGAQVDLGRWPLELGATPDPTTLSTAALGVVIGHYEDARGVRPLPSAVAEGEALAGRFRARSVDATDVYLDQALRGRFDDGFVFEGLHFAGHGVNDPDRHGAYLMLSNGRQLSEFVFMAADVAASGRAFLFLNACQVGTANQTLGSYAGVAGLAVRAGFRGFLAPLWSVSDDLAKDVSLGFYEASSAGETVGSYLRALRRRFEETATDPANATWLAYVYYGHPALCLDGPSPVETPV